VDIPEAWHDKRVLLHFGAVDYEATVWVNGDFAGLHEGGHSSFVLDITDQIRSGANSLVVRAWDPSTDRTLPRGKQFWKEKSESIWYTRTTGIWQPVWLEAVEGIYLTGLRTTPDIDRAQVQVEAFLSQVVPDLKVRVTVEKDGALQARAETDVLQQPALVQLQIANQQLWSPERPNLYDLSIEVLSGGKLVDRVESYFGQRKVSTHGGRFYLNNAPYYLKLVLDQGYWPESVLTPPSDEAIQYDIRTAKSFGLNGARKHQKVEDPRWLYWCDKLGFIVWGEMANAFDFSIHYISRFVQEWQQVIQRDYNHPSIVTWVPINESWGVRDILTNSAHQEHVKTLYALTHSLDQTRLVVDNDGWEHTDRTDLFTLHDYARTGELMAAKYKILETDLREIPRNGREALAFGYRYNGTPILMTEFGGIAFRAESTKTDNEWGYAGIEPTKEAMLQRLDGLVTALRGNSAIAGFCYTQLTDVEQEINGLMTYDRKPKATAEEFSRIFGK